MHPGPFSNILLYVLLRLVDEVALGPMHLEHASSSILCIWSLSTNSAPQLPRWYDRSAKGIVDVVQRSGEFNEAKAAELKSRIKLNHANCASAKRWQPGDGVMAERLADVVTKIHNVRQLGAARN